MIHAGPASRGRYSLDADGVSSDVTIAYAAATGAQRWLSAYSSGGQGSQAYSVAVSRTGAAVFVTGSSDGPHGLDYATIAYGTTTGAQVWVQRHNGFPQSVAVSHTGGTVFVTGQVYGSGKIVRKNYGTIAYRAATGERLWTARYDGPARQDDGATAVAVNPVGGTVFVTGESQGIGSKTDYVTLGYAP